MTRSTLERARRVSALHILYVAKMKIRKDVRDGIECRVNERPLFEKDCVFVFRDVPRDKTVEVSVSQIILERLDDNQAADIILRRVCQKFEDLGIEIPLYDEVAMEEEIPQQILQKVCAKLEGTNIFVKIDENSLNGYTFEFHDLGEDLYVNVVVSKELTENMTLDILASAIFRHMQREFEAKGVNVPVLEESDKPVVHSVDDVSDFTKPNIPGFGDWGQ